MRRPARHAVPLVIAGLFAISTLASAQRSMRGETRAEYPQSIGAMMGAPPPIPTSVAALVLEHADELKLADSQRELIQSVRRAQDSANMPWLAKLDSLRPTRQPAGGPGDLSQEQRDEMESRKIAIGLVLDGMKETNALSRKKVMDALDPEQQKRAAGWEEDARKRAEDEAKRRERDAQGGRRRGRQLEV